MYIKNNIYSNIDIYYVFEDVCVVAPSPQAPIS